MKKRNESVTADKKEEPHSCEEIDLRALEKAVDIMGRRLKKMIKKNGFSKKLKEKAE